MLGVSVDVPKIDPTGMSRSSTIVVKGQEQPVKKAKVLFEALAKGKQPLACDACLGFQGSSVLLFLPTGQSVAVLQFLPQHAVELSGRSSRNLERLRLLEGAVIEVDPATGIVVITSPESSIAKVTVRWSRACFVHCVMSRCCLPPPSPSRAWRMSSRSHSPRSLRVFLSLGHCWHS